LIDLGLTALSTRKRLDTKDPTHKR